MTRSKIRTSGAEGLTLSSTDITIDSGDLIFGTSAKGVNLGVTSNTDGNTIDDYEEGTFNLTMVGVNGSPSSTQLITSEYVKLGKLVTFRSFKTGVNNTGGVGQIYFTGIPFTPTGVCIVNIECNHQGTFSLTPYGYLSGTIIYINQMRSQLSYNTVNHYTNTNAEWSLTGHFFTNS